MNEIIKIFKSKTERNINLGIWIGKNFEIGYTVLDENREEINHEIYFICDSML